MKKVILVPIVICLFSQIIFTTTFASVSPQPMYGDGGFVYPILFNFRILDKLPFSFDCNEDGTITVNSYNSPFEGEGTWSSSFLFPISIVTGSFFKADFTFTDGVHQIEASMNTRLIPWGLLPLMDEAYLFCLFVGLGNIVDKDGILSKLFVNARR